MSDIIKKEIASAIKWIVVIAVAAHFYQTSKPFYFTKRGSSQLVRVHTPTGKVEILYDDEWIDPTENALAQYFREKRREDRDKSYKKTIAMLSKNDPLDFLDEFDESTPDFYAVVENFRKESGDNKMKKIGSILSFICVGVIWQLTYDYFVSRTAYGQFTEACLEFHTTIIKLFCWIFC